MWWSEVVSCQIDDMDDCMYSITQLQTLLGDGTDGQGKGGDSSDDELDTSLLPNPSSSSFTSPASIGTKATPTHSLNSTANKPPTSANSIWDDSEVEEKGGSDALVGDLEDGRARPEYDMKLSQNVSAEDMFLQMGYRNPSTACADNLIVRVWLKDTLSAKHIQLQLKSQLVDCRTESQRLTLSLPHPIDDQNGKAKFDVDTGLLTLTLPLNREYDFLHQS